MIDSNRINLIKALMHHCLKRVDGNLVRHEDIDVLPYGDSGLWFFYKGKLIGRCNYATTLFESLDKQEFYFTSRSYGD